MTKTKKALLSLVTSMAILTSQTFGTLSVSYAEVFPDVPTETTDITMSEATEGTETLPEFIPSETEPEEKTDIGDTSQETTVTTIPDASEDTETSQETISSETESEENTDIDDSMVDDDLLEDTLETLSESGEFTITLPTGEQQAFSKEDIITSVQSFPNGTIISLNEDVILPGTITLASNSELTFDLCGYRLSSMYGNRPFYQNAYSTLHLVNGTLSGGTPTGAGFRSHGGAIYIEAANLYATNVTFENNTAKLGAAIFANADYWGDEPSYVELNNCIISNNNVVGSNSITGAIHARSSTLKVYNSQIKDNHSDSGCAGIFFDSTFLNMDLEIKNSRIEGNIATATSNTNRAAAGITVQSGNVLLSGTVITQNSGMYVGGLRMETNASSSSISFNMYNSAIYNNSATEEIAEGVRANDIVIQVSTGSITGTIPAASTMNDRGYNFSTKGWVGVKHKDTTDRVIYRGDAINLSTLEKGWRYVLSCGEKPEKVAVINADRDDATFYDSLAEAIEAAQNGDTIRLIYRPNDSGVPNIINEQVTVRDKDITINLNGNKWISSDGTSPVLTIEGTGKVTMKGPSEGLGVIGTIVHNGESLTLNSHATVESIKLGDGRFVTLGENFVLNGKLNLVLTSDLVGADGRKLIEARSPEQAKELVPNVIVTPMIASTEITAEGSDIVKRQMNGIFIDGVNGNDSNDGKSAATAVKSFERAKQLAINMSNLTGEDVYIFVVNIVTVDGNETWDLPSNISLNRYHFERVLINVSGTLMLKNITIDGWSSKTEANKPLIRVFEGGTLNIESGVILKNNYHAPRYYTESGGAIHSKGIVNMSGGTISGNTSLMGGGIFFTGDKAVFTMTGGTIEGNTAKKGASGQTPSGGGVALDDGAKFFYKGGTIEGNFSEDDGFGGGISVGVSIWFAGCKSSYLEMTGGLVNNNTSGQNGGGIFVQSGNKADIWAGTISNNECCKNNTLSFNRGIFGGGGIYSNGPRSVSSHNIPQADVTLYDAFISNNTATSKFGAGIAGCATSDTFLRTEGATIYNNHGSDQIFVDPTSSGYGDTAKAYISEFAPGGGINHWEDENGNLMANDEKGSEVDYFDASKALHLSNDNAVGLDTEGRLAKVFITGNLSHAYGGGIGSNGSVTIMRSAPAPKDISIKVSKIWDDQNNLNGKRPTSITFNLMRKNSDVNWVKSTFITIKPNADGTWPEVIFEGIPNSYEYKVEEEFVEGYSSQINGNQIEGFTVINTLISEKSENPEETTTTTKPEEPEETTPTNPENPDETTTPSRPDISNIATTTNRPYVPSETTKPVSEYIPIETTVPDSSIVPVETIVIDSEDIPVETTMPIEIDVPVETSVLDIPDIPVETTVPNVPDESTTVLVKNPETGMAPFIIPLIIVAIALIVLGIFRKPKNDKF